MVIRTQDLQFSHLCTCVVCKGGKKGKVHICTPWGVHKSALSEVCKYTPWKASGEIEGAHYAPLEVRKYTPREGVQLHT